MQSLDIEVLEAAQKWLLEGRIVLLATVCQTFGASPRPPGSLMAMRDDGVLVGSVSGGCIEDDLVLRREEIARDGCSLETYGVTADEARRFGLPCGGALEVLVERLRDASRVASLLRSTRDGNIFVRVVDTETGSWVVEPHDGAEETRRVGTALRCVHGPRWRMLIIGASEIATYLAEIAKTLDFAVSVCDPREEYREAWRVAGVKFLTQMPDDAVISFNADPRSVIIAVSHDPKLDDMALMEALKTDAHYVGAVGSTKTSGERRLRLQSLEVTAEQAARLHGPVGLAIGSRTPPEIAIAICAELLALRSKRHLAADIG